MASKKEGKFEILTFPERCTGCLICELRCAQRFYKTASPLRAAIKIDAAASGRVGAVISFTDECDTCGICARSCAYGSLELKQREVRA